MGLAARHADERWRITEAGIGRHATEILPQR
jgi:hypothetical protein